MLVSRIVWCLLLGSISLNITEAKIFVLHGISDDVVRDFALEYDNYMHTRQMTPRLGKILDALEYVNESKNCILCHAGISFLITKRRVFGLSDDQMNNLLLSLCVTLKIQPKYVCSGIINIHLKLLLFILDSRPNLNENQFCGLIFQNKKAGCTLNDPLFDWTVNVDQSRAKHNSRGIIEDAYHRTTIQIAQITDPHIDQNYKKGANAVCGAALCCRSEQGIPEKPEEGAGAWGDYRGCDPPKIAVEDAYDQIRNKHKNINLIYFTGDIIDHAIWETSISGNRNKIRSHLSKLKEVFPNKMILPILGNHEPHPIDAYAPKNVPSEFSTQWLYDLIAQEWNVLMQNRLENLDTIRDGGYYTVLIQPGFRVIALNNNVAYVLNWWLLYDPVFPKEQLQWLHDTLLSAERNNEKVHILAHIPPGDPTNFVTWDREFKRIVERFSKVITNQFNGHSHNDEFTIFYSSGNKSKAIGSAFNGGSITTYENRNPNYKIYYVDRLSFKVIEHESWIYNLTKANLNSYERPEWFKMYSFKKDFGLRNLEPESLSKLVEKMYSDKKLAYRYFTYKVKQADTALEKGCDNRCLKNHLCDVVTSVPNEEHMCDIMEQKFGESNLFCKFLRLITLGLVDTCTGL